MPSTTIKVSRELHDRLAVLARQEHTTLAGAIERSLDAVEAGRFWDRLARAVALSPPADELERVAGTLRDGLEPEDWADVL